MVLVTDLQYGLETRLVAKLDLMIDRCTREKPAKDTWMICEGGEGEGKTNASLAIAYYVKSKTNRDIHLFFRLKDLIDFAKNNEKKIIIWDEPALDSLKSDGQNKLNKDFKRLIATCRVKRHFLITNMTRFYIFNEYLVVDRCLGMVHMYSRNEVEPGRFIYIKKRKLEELYRIWNSKHVRNYKGCKAFGGSFPEVMEKHFNKLGIHLNGKPSATILDYKQAKDEGIESIGEEEKKPAREVEAERKLAELRYKIASLTVVGRETLAAHLGIDSKRLREWAKRGQNQSISLGKVGFEGAAAGHIMFTRGDQDKSPSESPAEPDLELTV